MKFFLSRNALTNKVGAFLVLSLLFSISCESLQKKSIQHATQLQSIGNAQRKKVPPIVISFLGDIIIHERLRHREESSNEGYQSIWQAIQKYINLSDTTYANLEGPVAPEIGGVSGFPLFNFPEEIIPTLKQSGIDIVSTANNHALDRKAIGVELTIHNLKRYELAFSGTVIVQDDENQESQNWWGLTTIKNSTSKVAWIACTEMTNGHIDTKNQILYCYKNKDKILSFIQSLKERSEIAGIILTPHWGEEEKFDIEDLRREWAQQMLNQGAAAVVGSHPHVVQKIENYKTADGRNTFIAYSLGNFISNQPRVPNKTSMMLLSKWTLNDAHKLELQDLKYLALWMNRTDEKNATSKYRISIFWDLIKMPVDAISIWQQQLGAERRLKSSAEADFFFGL